MARIGNSTEAMSQDTLSVADANNANDSKDFVFGLKFSSSYQWIILTVLFVLALVVNFYRLGVPSIWFDEAFSTELSRQPLPLLLHYVFGPEPNMGLYYLMLHFWLMITGFLGFHQTEFVVRAPSAVFAALSAVVIFLIARRYIGLLAGIIAILLYLLNCQELIYAQQVRSYALQLALLCLTWYALFNALTRKDRVRWWLLVYVIAASASVYAQLFSLFVLFAQIVAIAGILVLPNAWRAQARKQLLAFVISICAIGILCSEMIFLSRQGSKTAGWIPIPHLHDIYGIFFGIADNYRLYFYSVMACLAIGILIVFISYCLQYFLPYERRTLAESNPAVSNVLSQYQYAPLVWSLLCWLIIPIVVSYILSQGATRIFSSRYLVVVVPPFFLLVGLGLTTLRYRSVQAVLAALLIVLAVTQMPNYYKSAQLEDWNAASHWVIDHYKNGDVLSCYDNNQGCQVSIEYYLHAYPTSGAHFTTDAPSNFSWATGGFSDPNLNASRAVDIQALSSFSAKHSRLFFISGRLSSDQEIALVKNAEHWLDSHYHYMGQIVTNTVTVRLYTTGNAK